MFWLLYGIILAGLKFPFNWMSPDAKFEDIQKVGDFGLYRGPRLQDAWERLDESRRINVKRPFFFHNLTNLAIEWNREWLPLSTKFISALFVYSNILWVICSILF
jgi:hypothetical protein